MKRATSTTLWIFPIALAMSLSAPLAPGPAIAADVPGEWPADSIAAVAPPVAPGVDPSTWVDHDGQPISKPRLRERNLYGHMVREGFVEPASHFFDVPDKILWLLDRFGADTERPSANANVFDEVPNSTWFTNRNHVRSVSTEEIRRGPRDGLRPAMPWTIKSVKTTGVNPGFNIKDAAGNRWVVKLDPPGCPQLGSGADVVSSRLLLAAGYNLPHDVTVAFRRDELAIDEDLLKGAEGEPPFTEKDLDDLLARGHRSEEGRFYGQASLFLPGESVGPINFRGKRPDDPNDWYTHRHRRELRGLYVFASWLNHWDAKDHQSLDMFESRPDSLGHVKHYLLDVGATLGAAAEGAKKPARGYEYRVDYTWIAKRFVSLGFAVEPWRRVNQETGIPSVGNFESAGLDPEDFRPLMPHAAFRECTARDAYWGAKIVASFSDAQIAAAIEAANYEDPRAREYLQKTLIERRDKVARFWFRHVVPVDFFHVSGGALHFHDLAVDRWLESPRHYEVQIKTLDGGTAPRDRVDLSDTVLDLEDLGDETTRVRLRFFLPGIDAEPTTVELERHGEDWSVVRVRHA